MTKTIYRLRPHHIPVLGLYVAFGREFTPNSDYGKAFNSKLARYLESLCKSVGEIEIVSALDDICLLGCDRRHQSCEKPDNPHDTGAHHHPEIPIYGIEFKVGVRYPISYLMKIDLHNLIDSTSRFLHLR